MADKTTGGGLPALLRGPARGLLIAAALLALVLVGLDQAWKRWGQATTANDEYIVTPAKIIVTPQPKWIRADVRAEVIRDGSLSRLDLRDRGVLEKVSQAFALHSWVAKVARVQKSFPAQIRVDLEYRRPMAMVEVNTRGRPGLLFIDGSGVLLPSADFTTDESHHYLRISAGNVAPGGVYGTPWGNEKIAGAARLAAAWGERWQALGLYRIVVIDGSQPMAATYELRTKSGTRAIWGRAPGNEAQGEPQAAEKVQRLLALTEGKPLDQLSGQAVIDLRSAVPAK